MRTTSEIKELKLIPIIDFLANKGINPISKSGNWLMYSSPLRQEKTPSFGVNTAKNIFNDLGSEDKGNIIELVMMLENIGFVDACKFLESKDLVKENENIRANFFSPIKACENITENYQITVVKDLQHPALIRYVESRKISFQNAFKYLNEIHYTNAKGNFFGVGYQTESGGYVVRSELMKKPINLGKSGIKTFIVPNSKHVSIFEGMFDFLSACEFYKGSPTMTAIILNSVNNLNKAKPIISQYEKVFCYLDNDDAGHTALKNLKLADINVLDKSSIYEKYKDFNEFLIVGTKQ